MNWDRAKTYGRLASRLLGILAVVGAVVTLGVQGWQWQSTVEVDRVLVTNTRHAPADTVRHLARIDSGTVMQTIDEALVIDRVARHPWVRTADVTKQRAQRTLQISVSERVPVALVISDTGEPAYYFDREGYAMPQPDSGGYDVPLVRGLEAEYHPMRQVGPSTLRTLLGALPDSNVESLVAEIMVADDKTIQLITTPVGTQGPLRVRLGNGAVESKLQRLHAFATQVLPTDKETPIAEVDLRFANQIVTREHPLDESPS